MISLFSNCRFKSTLEEFSEGYEFWLGLAFVFVDPVIVHDANMLEIKREEKRNEIENIYGV